MATATPMGRDLVSPDGETAAWAADAVRALEELLKRHPDPSTRSVLLASHGEAVIEVPSAALEMLFDVLAHMAIADTVVSS